MGTPEEVRVASVRQNRATAILRRIMPMIGALSMAPSMIRRPRYVL